ncbi:MAG: SpoIIE family protein phosphatase [Bacteroidales bacterium]|jgi:serine phosphatase RsbU (regulator of sigma subunit)/ligand-binding sensor domain-containing protein
MKRIFLIILAILLSASVLAQLNKQGVPAIINYNTKVTQAYDYNWSIVEDKTNVLYFASETKGIIRFDGHRWSVIPVRKEALVRVLCVANDGVIYAGGAEEFGFVQPEGNGSLKYVSISSRFDKPAPDSTLNMKKDQNKSKQNITIGQIFSIITKGSLIYFQSQESLFIYDPAKDSVKYVNLRNFGLMQVIRMVNVNNRIVLSDNISGLYELKEDKPVRLPGGEFFSMKWSTVIMPEKENSLFIGTYTDGVFLLDLTTGKVSTTVLDPLLNDKLKSALLYTSVDLHTGERLLGTGQDGIFIIDKDHKFIGKWDNMTTDMADNAIMTMYIGENPSSELWFATLGNISKAYVGIPYTEISDRTGSIGGINSVAYFDGSVFLSSDNGLFRSYLNSNGIMAFRRVANINLEVYPLNIGKFGDKKFLLAGSKLGLYQLFSNGSILKVDEVMKYTADFKKSILSIRSILQSEKFPDRFYLGMETKGIVIAEYNGKDWSFIKQVKSVIKGNISSMVENEAGDVFIFTANPTSILRLAANDTVPTEFSSRDGLPETTINAISKIKRDIVASTAKGLFRFNNENHQWVLYDELVGGYSKDINCRDLTQDSDGDFWLATLEDRIREILFRKDSTGLKMYKGPLNLLPDVDKGDFKYFENKYWMSKSKSVYVIDKNKIFYPKPEISALLTKIVIGGDSLLMNSTFFRTLPDGKNVASLDNRAKTIPQIKFNYNSVSFSWTMPFYVDEESTLYSYKLDGFDKSWSKWEKVFYKDYTNLPFGKYTFRIKARTATGIESKEASYEFNILKPWYFTTVMIILYFIGFVVLIIVIIMAYTRKLKNENIRLEGIVAERTAVVVKQKEELESSIHYASRIQMALLPSEAILKENLKNYFILFKPRDIVSGDFYWMTKKGERLYIVAADCTGHGVPGAFMSLLGMSFLDEIIDKVGSPRADQILSELRLHVTESLKQSGGDDEAKDGMDMALLVIDFNVSRIEFSGAYNPCFRVRKMTEEETRIFHDEDMEMPDGSMSNGKYLLETIYASKMPIGISSRMNEKFVFYDWNLEKGISYYLFSDGYIDQFGGEHGRKFMKKNFKKLILDIQDYPMNRQKELLDQNLKDWMGHSPQIDDILVMGLRTE